MPISPNITLLTDPAYQSDVNFAINSKFGESFWRQPKPYLQLGITNISTHVVYADLGTIQYQSDDVTIYIDGYEYNIGAPADFDDLVARLQNLDIGIVYYEQPNIHIVGFHTYGNIIQGSETCFEIVNEYSDGAQATMADVIRELALRVSYMYSLFSKSITAAGSNYMIQYNKNGNFGADSNLTWDYNSYIFTIKNGTNDLFKIDGLSNNYGRIYLGYDLNAWPGSPRNSASIQCYVDNGYISLTTWDWPSSSLYYSSSIVLGSISNAAYIQFFIGQGNITAQWDVDAVQIHPVFSGPYIFKFLDTSIPTHKYFGIRAPNVCLSLIHI